MKKAKRLIILCAVLAVLCAATVILTLTEQKQEQIRASGDSVLSVATESVTAISWSYEDADSFSFVKEEGVWYVSNDRDFPVSEEKLETVLAVFSDLRASFTIEEVTDLDQYGLKTPECSLELTADGKTYKILLGDFSPLDQLRYASIGDGKVYLVSQDPMDSLYTSLSHAIEHDTIPDFTQITGVTIAGQETLSISRLEDSDYSYSDSDIYFLQQDGKYLPLETSAMTQYVNTVAGLTLLDYTSYKADDSILESCGLLEPELSVTVHFCTDDADSSCTVHIGQNQEELVQAREAEAAGEEELPVTRYVRVGDSPIIYVLDDLDYGVLTAASYNDLRHSQVFWGDFTQVTGISFVLEENDHAFSSSLTEDGERSWLYGETQIDLTSLEQAVSLVSVTEFTEAAPTGKEELQLTLQLEDTSISLSFYRHDGSSCLVQIGGETVGLVSRSSVVDLVEALQTIIL